MKTPRSIYFIRETMLLVLVAVLCLLFAEAAVRIFNIGPEIYPVFRNQFRLSENPILKYEMVPNSPDGISPINSAGTRDRHHSYEKPGNTFRIACFGDSICYGLGVSQQQTFSSCLERLLNTYFSNTGLIFEVMNFGVPGYNFLQITETVRLQTLKYHPDAIIYAYCLNDTQEFSWELAGLLSEMTVAQERYLDIFKENGMVFRKSRLFLLTRYLIQSATESGGEKLKIDTRDPQMLAIKNGTYIQYFSQLYQPEYLLNRFEPGLNQLKSVSEKHHLPINIFVFPVMKDFNHYPLVQIHGTIEAMFLKESFQPFDLLGIYEEFQEKEKVKTAIDALHPTAEGHEIAALVMLYKLIEKGDIPGAKIEDFKKIMATDSAEGRYSTVISQKLTVNPI